MSSKDSNSSQYIQPSFQFEESTLSHVPEHVAADPDIQMSIDRGIEYGKKILETPEIQMLIFPGQKYIPDDTQPANLSEEIPVAPTKAVLGSRAKKDLTLAEVSSLKARVVPANPEGRSPAALRRQQEILANDLRSIYRQNNPNGHRKH